MSVTLMRRVHSAAAAEALKKWDGWRLTRGGVWTYPIPILGFRGVTPGKFLKI